jgi:hypothetical protein
MGHMVPLSFVTRFGTRGTMSLLVFLRHRIMYKRTNANLSIHPGVFQGIKSTGQQEIYHIYRIE